MSQTLEILQTENPHVPLLPRDIYNARAAINRNPQKVATGLAENRPAIYSKPHPSAEERIRADLRRELATARDDFDKLKKDSDKEIEELKASLAGQRYLADDGLATVAHLARRIGRPLLVEGEPGVGKTELAKALAGATGTSLLRLQCYEGIDVHHALYDWDYQRQLLHLRAGESDPLYSERFLIRRPLLEALQEP